MSTLTFPCAFHSPEYLKLTKILRAEFGDDCRIDHFENVAVTTNNDSEGYYIVVIIYGERHTGMIYTVENTVEIDSNYVPCPDCNDNDPNCTTHYVAGRDD